MTARPARRHTEDDFTSNALVALARAAFARGGLPLDVDAGGAARASIAAKRALLGAGFARFGADGLLAVGAEIAHLPWHPVLAVFRGAPDVPALVERWQRLERYFHGRHRTRVLHQAPGRVVLEHHAVHGAPPTLHEDLLIAGVVAGLVVDAGGIDVDAELLGAGPFLARGRAVPLGAAPHKAARFELAWTGFAPRHAAAAQASSEPASASLPARVRHLFAADPARRWSLAGVAAGLGMAPRALQRALAGAGTSFRDTLQRARADHAARQLASGLSLAATGYACGYSDQAHFTRQFQRCIGLPPGVYRSSL